MSIAKKVREYKTANPKADVVEIAKSCNTSIGYVYQILHHAKKAAKKAKAASEVKATPQPTDGQQTLRKEIKHLNEAIDKWRNVSSFHEGRIDVLTKQVRDLKAHNSGLEYVISYLESRLGIEAKDGASV